MYTDACDGGEEGRITDRDANQTRYSDEPEVSSGREIELRPGAGKWHRDTEKQRGHQAFEQIDRSCTVFFDRRLEQYDREGPKQGRGQTENLAGYNHRSAGNLRIVLRNWSIQGPFRDNLLQKCNRARDRCSTR